MGRAKGQPLQLRVEPAEKAFWPDDTLAERQGIQLTPHAAEAFSEALYAPASVNERLAKALERPRKFAWLG